MPVTGFNHINIRTTDVAASARFYEDVLGFAFREGPTVRGNRQCWLYDGAGRPIIHLRVMAADTASTGPIDHVALDCTDQMAIVARLKDRKIPFAVINDLLPGVTQVFLKDLHGVALELNFASSGN